MPKLSLLCVSDGWVYAEEIFICDCLIYTIVFSCGGWVGGWVGEGGYQKFMTSKNIQEIFQGQQTHWQLYNYVVYKVVYWIILFLYNIISLCLVAEEAKHGEEIHGSTWYPAQS